MYPHPHPHSPMVTTTFWSQALPNMPADRPYAVAWYGPELAANKAKLLSACVAARAPTPVTALLVAMAMIETNTMSADDRDSSKDGRPDGSANVSLFNLSVDLVARLGYRGDPSELNAPGALPAVVALLVAGVHAWGVVGLLNYVRGGYTAFMDGVSYDAYGYRDTVATLLRVFDADPALLYDGRRVEVQLQHV